MNTKLLFLILLALSLGEACSRSEIAGVNAADQAIRLDATTGKTKATDNTLATLQADPAGFGVYALQGASQTPFITNHGYHYVNNAWEWIGTPVQWPAEGTGYPINFYAYYPMDETTLGPTLQATYTIPDDVTAQRDLLAANKLNIITRPGSGNVSLAFQHILSKVNIQIAPGSAVTVSVQSVTLRNVGNNREFQYGTLAWAIPDDIPGNQSYNYQSLANPAASFVGSVTRTPRNIPNTSSMMLMPQSRAPWDQTVANLTSGSYVEVVYRVVESATGKDLVGYTHASDHPGYAGSQAEINGYDGPLFVKVGFTFGVNWLQGKAYLYTVYLGSSDTSGGIITEGNFVDEEGNVTDLPVVNPDNGDPILPDEPVVDLNRPIGFIVSVETWDNSLPDQGLK